ncbi:glyoxysomal processing protease, glyoxysomal isoform X1 [Cannabis sativa]|uniref:glyoxysomal processing protease, glyoxysomal isoform X1 n=1 Tax=Cannabis sativa TaxID=3483 RepID=UPI0011DF8C59|nr:glyoxysomal processing protease, glyoxysomal isoform X1 [Cannabis sativa]
MGLPETLDLARIFAVMVRVQGPDPKGLKMRNHAFHQYHSGRTTLSASGMLLPHTLYDSVVAEQLCGDGDRFPVLVVTVASVVEPFLSAQHKQNNISQGRPQCIPGVQVDIMIEKEIGLGNDSNDLDREASRWHAAQCLKIIDVPASASALQSLFEASVGSLEHGWEVGWSLASLNESRQSLKYVSQTHVSLVHPAESGTSSQLGKLTTRMAILGVSLFSNDVAKISISPSSRKGDFILAVGSPFGVLSPVHFFNSISVGSIANCYPPRSSSRSLLMADIRCLPGMEGGPIFDGQAQVIGILIRPLRQKISGAEIQLVIPWEAIASACSDLLLKEPHTERSIYYGEGKLAAVGRACIANSHGPDGHVTYTHKDLSSCCPTPVEKAMTSVCLITVDDGVWASGVLLNNDGLILTNAHLLEPWRFGKRTADPFIGGEHGMLNWTSSYSGSRNIRVRLDHVDPWIWCDAKVVFVCKGPLDVALLQLESIPNELCPIVMDFSRPSVGSKAFVVGHGLFGPRCGFFPSVCSGVVAKVVEAKLPHSYQQSQPGSARGNFPVMLETTAAVHPGSSGGAVVNMNGHLIGLVTSNARHGGGTVIPHLNFSIPCSALLPIFKFSEDMQDSSLLQILDQPNEDLSFVWALMPPLSPKVPPLPALPVPLLVDKENKKEAKGSRFAKFIAERQEVLQKPTELGERGKQSSVIVPSKL